jgi:hypothetical protein
MTCTVAWGSLGQPAELRDGDLIIGVGRDRGGEETNSEHPRLEISCLFNPVA